MVGDLLKYRGHKQQLSFFIEGWKPYIDLNGRLHPSFKLHGTVTGRLSCENPNLQQVPRDPRIRSHSSLHPRDGCLSKWIYRRLNFGSLLSLADEHNLLRVFNKGGDPHWQTAIREIERGAGYKKIIKTVKLHSGQKMNYSEAVEYILKMGGDEAVETVASGPRLKALSLSWTGRKHARRRRLSTSAISTACGGRSSRSTLVITMEWKSMTRKPKHPEKLSSSFILVSQHGTINSGVLLRSMDTSGLSLEGSGVSRQRWEVEILPERREAQRQAINSPVQSFR
jgi:hypothetical protein